MGREVTRGLYLWTNLVGARVDQLGCDWASLLIITTVAVMVGCWVARWGVRSVASMAVM